MSSAGFEPSNFGSRGEHLTVRPTTPTLISFIFLTFTPMSASSRSKRRSNSNFTDELIQRLFIIVRNLCGRTVVAGIMVMGE